MRLKPMPLSPNSFVSFGTVSHFYADFTSEIAGDLLTVTEAPFPYADFEGKEGTLRAGKTNKDVVRK